MAKFHPDQTTREHAPEATSRGILSDGALVAHYYTAEPSPDRWIAVGTVMFWPETQRLTSPRWMLVGAGRAEPEAVADLRVRMRQHEPPQWRITCDPPDRVVYRHFTEIQSSGRYVVPWEIEIDEDVLPAEFVAGETPPPLS
ncbi:MAG: hypothetical protein WBW04_13315 [Nitrolancea sp.]